MKFKLMLPLMALTMLAACSKDDDHKPGNNEDPAAFSEIGSLDIGEGCKGQSHQKEPADREQ